MRSALLILLAACAPGSKSASEDETEDASNKIWEDPIEITQETAGVPVEHFVSFTKDGGEGLSFSLDDGPEGVTADLDEGVGITIISQIPDPGVFEFGMHASETIDGPGGTSWWWEITVTVE